MANRSLDAARRAIDVAVGAVPGSVVERLTAAGAPLSRYSGRTRAGAVALSSTLAALTRPPRVRRRRRETVSVDAIAAEVGRSDEEVERWARSGVLGPADENGTWGPEALDRAALADFALRRGADERTIAGAARDGRLALLVLELVVAGEATLTGNEVARRAGVTVELATAIWRAFGFPAEAIHERRFSRGDVHAMRVIGAMQSVFTMEDLVEAASVLGRAMAEVSAAAVELFRRRVTEPFLEVGLGELDITLRLSAMTELLIPPLEPVLEVALRRHLQAAVQAEAALQLEEAASPQETQQVAIGFADLVGFTTLSERMSPLELGKLANGLLRAAEPAFQRNNARVVKSIGDAVMFTAREPIDSCSAALDLIDAVSATEDDMPPVRVGIAIGPVLRAYADYFGRTVNIASRLCDAAGPGDVLLYAPELDRDDPGWAAAGLRLSSARRLNLKGIAARVEAVQVRRAR